MAGPGNRQPKGFAKPKNTKKTFLRILSYMGAFKIRLVFVILGIIVSSLATIAGNYMLKPLINSLGEENPDMKAFAVTLVIMGVIYLLGALASYLYSRIMVSISTKTLYNIRCEMFEKLQKLPIKYFDTHTHGELMSRFTNDTDTLREMLSNSFPHFISSAMTVAGVFVMMLVLSPHLTVLVMAMVVLIIALVKKIGSRSGRYFKTQQKELGSVNGYIEEMIDGQKVVKVFCYEDKAKEEFAKRNESLRLAATNANTFANILGPIMNNLGHTQYAITAMAGSLLIILNIGGLDIGSLASFLMYTRSFSQPITQISQQFNSVLNALAGAERIFEMMDEIPETDEGYVTLVNAKFDDAGNIYETKEHTGIWAWKHPHSDGTLTYTQLKGEVTFDDVVFAYEEGKTVLNGISLYAKPGQKIAFVGSTGAGKTTIINLINRFYDVPDGKIRYDGININKIKKADLRHSLSMVLQDTHLFTGTVMENIRYGRLDATDEEVKAAARLANADTFINHLPQGYDTMLTADGGNLSQGQRQLLAIARAAVADPPVLVLDEATSSIDTRTEALIEKGMDSLMQGRTVFVIAHRLSTVRNADAIMVLENGRIIERGNHDELMKIKGKYYQLYTGMFELE